MFEIRFRDYPEDKFDSFYDFPTRSEAVKWFNAFLDERKKAGAEVTVFKNWPENEESLRSFGLFTPTYSGKFVKGYCITGGEKPLWVLILSLQ
jgi:hypothetical protein